MTRKLLILQHVPWERPALLGDILTAHGVEWELDNVVTATSREALPRLDELSGVVILGGPMGALDAGAHPGLGLEADLVREAFDGGVPLLGICLGHQIVATALGAALHSGAADEVGMGEVTVAADDAAFGRAGTSQPVLHWHHDVVEAPDGATVVASTAQTPNQAFRIGDAVFATQFHPEIDARMLGEWLAVPEMAEDLSADVARTVAADFAAAEARMRPLADAAFGAFAGAARSRL
ncbi:GMP synthase (glutamine-hydrolyzing) [Conyzicola lurida]|uniref:GMP synthase (Glutamine-hydrolyzing) n=1 Tax=Conyzicola lurida TaxID=1172621 RepID=A0A841ANU0_9MICO|nr:GMP synthase (glutamine-hydrolyzing) [Conyzicola lurida]